MRSSGIKHYFANRQAEKADPKDLAAYEKSMDKVLPRISQKVRESETLASSLGLSRNASMRSRKRG